LSFSPCVAHIATAERIPFPIKLGITALPKRLDAESLLGTSAATSSEGRESLASSECAGGFSGGKAGSVIDLEIAR